MGKIVIVTSGQPSANPRVVKEATALDNAGFSVSVIYVPLSPWADDLDKELFLQTPSINWIRASIHPLQQPTLYKLVRLRRKLYELLFKYLPFASSNYEYAFVLYAQELRQMASSTKADLFIGHNLGALPAAVHAAKKWKAKSAFDAEDYHRGEASVSSTHYKFAVSIENKYMPQLSYLSAASPLIAEAYKKLFPAQDVFTLNNVFSRQYLQPLSDHPKDGLSLFWFSQTVGTNRGLEVVIEALNKLRHLNISFNILGECSLAYKEELMRLAVKPSSLSFITSKPLKEIFIIASRFDIGIASEVPYCENRDICLTNKLFTYLLSGNCILASNTKAQLKFLKDYNGVGEIYNYDDAADLAGKIEHLYNYRQLLLQYRQRALALAKEELNWEAESKNLLSKVDTLLSSH